MSRTSAGSQPRSSTPRKTSSGPRGHLVFGTMPQVAGDPRGLYERAWRRCVGAGAYGVQGSREAVNVADGDGAPDHGDGVLAWS
jgi:hypothetical protein